MWFCLFGILMIRLIRVLGGASSSNERTAHRDYANKIGMVCSYDKTENGTLYLELGENDQIGDRLEPFGQNGKVIFHILGYAADMNPNDRGQTLTRYTYDTKEWIRDNITVVCAFDFVHQAEAVGACCILPDYRKQVNKRIPFAAKIIKNVAAEMYGRVFDSFDNFELVGFSLGAHIAGYTAKLIKSEFGETVSRIFAIDPAKTFVCNNAKNELEKTDAKYVQAIFSSCLSQHSIDVHCKVFINGGSHQPLCENRPPLIRDFCSHNYVLSLYNEIGAGKRLFAFAVSQENEKYGMMIGHLSHENAIGVFNANTDYIPGRSQEQHQLQDFLRT